jgi:hypothetical protein
LIGCKNRIRLPGPVPRSGFIPSQERDLRQLLVNIAVPLAQLVVFSEQRALNGLRFVELTDATQRVVLQVIREAMLWQVLAQAVFEQAGRETEHAHAVARDFFGE